MGSCLSPSPISWIFHGWMFYKNSSKELFQRVSKYAQILPFKRDYLYMVWSTTKLGILDWRGSTAFTFTLEDKNFVQELGT